MPRHTVGIFLFEQVEVLDFAGPFEVFSRTRLEPGLASRRSDEQAPFSVFTVAETAGMITATGGLQVVPQYTFETAPAIDLLVIPGWVGHPSVARSRAGVGMDSRARRGGLAGHVGVLGGATVGARRIARPSACHHTLGGA